jgi:hypothetical protein
MLIYGVDALNDVTGEQRLALFSSSKLALAWLAQFDPDEWDCATFWQELDQPEQHEGSVH